MSRVARLVLWEICGVEKMQRNLSNNRGAAAMPYTVWLGGKGCVGIADLQAELHESEGVRLAFFYDCDEGRLIDSATRRLGGT